MEGMCRILLHFGGVVYIEINGGSAQLSGTFVHCEARCLKVKVLEVQDAIHGRDRVLQDVIIRCAEHHHPLCGMDLLQFLKVMDYRRED